MTQMDADVKPERLCSTCVQNDFIVGRPEWTVLDDCPGVV